MPNGKKNGVRGILAEVREAAAAAQEEVLHKRMREALINSQPEDVVGVDSEGEVVKGNAQPSTGWLHSPAMMEFLATAYKRLVRAQNLAGNPANTVAKVHAKLIRGTKYLVIKPAPEEDQTAIPVKRHGSSTFFNLIDLLGPERLAVESGYRQRYVVAWAPQESPHWPALAIDLGDPKEREREPDEEQAKAGTRSQDKAKTGARKAAANKPRTGTADT